MPSDIRLLTPNEVAAIVDTPTPGPITSTLDQQFHALLSAHTDAMVATTRARATALHVVKTLEAMGLLLPGDPIAIWEISEWPPDQTILPLRGIQLSIWLTKRDKDLGVDVCAAPDRVRAILRTIAWVAEAKMVRQGANDSYNGPFWSGSTLIHTDEATAALRFVGHEGFATNCQVEYRTETNVRRVPVVTCTG